MSTVTTFAGWDQQQLVQMALQAGQRNDAGTALAVLQEAVSRPDASAAAHFLLGAEYAQSRSYEQALQQYEAAVAIDPSLAIARFQLGLLCLTMAQVDRSRQVLSPLLGLPESKALKHFAQGLLALMNDALGEAEAALLQGLACQDDNAALNADMHKIIEQIRLLQAGQAPADAKEDQQEDAPAEVNQLFLSTYKGHGQL